MVAIQDMDMVAVMVAVMVVSNSNSSNNRAADMAAIPDMVSTPFNDECRD